jgi:hypothetical protein
MYISGHSGLVAIAAEVGTITESADGTTPAVLPAIPSSAALVGYTPNMPELSANLGNSKGYAVGDSRALYNRPGSPSPSATFQLVPGSGAFLVNYCQRYVDSTLSPTGRLKSFALFIGAAGVFTDVIRFCKVNELAIALQESLGGGQGGEISASITAMGLARQSLTTPIGPNAAALRALGIPLMWHDVRTFGIDLGAGSIDYRKALMGLNVTLSHNLERKGVRPDWGDDVPLSRTNYELLEHTITARAEVQLHSRLSRAAFYGAVRAQQWGDITVDINDAEQTKQLNLLLEGAVPENEVLRGVAAGEQMSHSVPLLLDNIVLS